MAKIRPLTPKQAKRTFANRFAPTADRLRQLATNFGVRPYRVFLTWTKWTGTERGEGVENLIRQIEILPTPVVQSLDNLSFSIAHAGVIPVGSLKLSRVSVHTFTEDVLTGKSFPDNPLPFNEDPREKHIPEPYEFFYEVVEDGRGDEPPKRRRFRLMSTPFRKAGGVHWTMMLEKTSEDRTRNNKSGMGTGLE